MKFKQFLFVLLIFTGLFTSKPVLPAEQSFASTALKIAITSSTSSILLTSFIYIITKVLEAIPDNDKIIEVQHNDEFKTTKLLLKKVQDSSRNKKLFLTFAPEIIAFSSLNQLIATVRYDLINQGLIKNNKTLFIIGSGISTIILFYKYLKFINIRLKQAVKKNDLNEIKLLSYLGANINGPYFDANFLEKALQSKQTETAKFILNHPLFVMSSKDLDTYFRIALHNYLDDIVEILIKKGFDINKPYKENKTYLEYFLYKKQLKMSKFLVKHGAYKFRDGSNIIDHSNEISQIQELWDISLVKYVNQGNIGVIKERLSVGANPYVRVKYNTQINNDVVEVNTSLYRFVLHSAQEPSLSVISKELLKANGETKVVDQNTPNQDLCQICIDIGNGELYPTKCKHYFHINCLNQWLKGNGNGKCPTCRTEQ
ncbi:MAG: RING finger domain-containing protein [Candidatus Babeliales bacterium]|nr:RING finger domain-containing protein [Candidatus Babeliales bacterium]